VLKETIADDRRSSPLSVAKISIVFVVGNMPHVGGSAVVPDQRSSRRSSVSSPLKSSTCDRARNNGRTRHPHGSTATPRITRPSGAPVCKDAIVDLDSLSNAIETGVREALSHPQTRTQFDQVVGQTLRADLLLQAGINPMSPAQIHVIEAAFRGTDYVVKYLPR